MQLKLKEINTSNRRNKLKNPNWRKADQLAIYKYDQTAKLGSTRETTAA